MRKSLAAAADCCFGVTLLVVCVGGGRRSSSACRRAPPRIGTRRWDPPSRLRTSRAAGRWSWSGAARRRPSDRCVVGDRFTFRIYPGCCRWAPGDSVWAAVDGGSRDAADAPVAGVAGRVGPPPRPRAGNGAADAGDGSAGAPSRRTRRSPSGTGSRARPRSRLRSSLRSRFEIRFTLPGPVCDRRGRRPCYAYVLSARFDVDDSSPPVGGLIGRGDRRQTWARSMRFTLNGADVGGGLCRGGRRGRRRRCPVAGAGRSRGRTCHDIGPDPTASTSTPPPSRARCASTTARWTSTRSQLPQGQHVVRVLLEDAAGNRTPIFGPVTRTITSSDAIGPGSDPALRGAANGDGASDLARLTRALGPAGEPDACS